MTLHPPPLLVALIRTLLPPADREHVLGDLQERLQLRQKPTPQRYLFDAIQTVPLVVWSRMRRVLTEPTFILQAVLVFAAFVTVLVQPRLSATPLLVLRALFPTLVATCVLLVADTYRTPGRRPAWNQLLVVAVAVIAVWFSNVLAIRSGFSWSLPLVTMRRGLMFEFFLLSWVRFMCVFREAHEHLDRAIPNTLADLRAHVENFEREIRRRNQFAYAVCAVLIVGFGRMALVVATQIEMMGAALVVVASVFLAYQVSRFPAAALPTGSELATALQFYRDQLRRQRDFHRGRALSLRLALLLPGPLLLFLGLMLASPNRARAVTVQLGVFIALAILAVPLNQRVAHRYDRRLKALDTTNEKV